MSDDGNNGVNLDGLIKYKREYEFFKSDKQVDDFIFVNGISVRPPSSTCCCTSNNSSVSLPVKRISHEDWPGSSGGLGGSTRLIPSFSAKKIRQILLASRRSNKASRNGAVGNSSDYIDVSESSLNNQSSPRTCSFQVNSPSVSSEGNCKDPTINYKEQSINNISRDDNKSSCYMRNVHFSSIEAIRGKEHQITALEKVQSDTINKSNRRHQRNEENFTDCTSTVVGERCAVSTHSSSTSFAIGTAKSAPWSLAYGRNNYGNPNCSKHINGRDIQLSQLYISQGQCHMDILKEEIHLMELLEQGVLIFNNTPEEGILYMIENKLIENDPLYIANFLLHTDFLDKKKVGELLGGHSNLSLSILNNYVHLFNTSSLEPDVALRYFLSRFFLPGESQMVYRILERFSVSYIRDNPNSLFTSDQVHTLCYALVMLNTSLHNPHVRTKMTKRDFASMCTHSSLPVTTAQLETMYDRVLENEFRPFLSPSEKIYGRLARDPKVLRSKQISSIHPVLLQKGSIFRKYHRRNKPIIIVAWISSDEKFFCWKRIRRNSASFFNPNIVVSNSSLPQQSASSVPDKFSKSFLKKKIQKLLHLDNSDMHYVFLEHIIDINVSISGSISFQRYSRKLQNDMESRCFSIITKSGETIDLCTIDSTYPSLLMWTRFFHQIILKNQEISDSTNNTSSNKINRCGAQNSVSKTSATPYACTNLENSETKNICDTISNIEQDNLKLTQDQDRGIENGLLRVWYHGIFLRWESHWSHHSYAGPNQTWFNNNKLNPTSEVTPQTGPDENSFAMPLTSSNLNHQNNTGINNHYHIISQLHATCGESQLSYLKNKRGRSGKFFGTNLNIANTSYKTSIYDPEYGAQNRGLIKFEKSWFKKRNIFKKYSRSIREQQELNNIWNLQLFNSITERPINYQAPISHLILYLWTNNLPHTYRGILWSIAIGNILQINLYIFQNLLEQRRKVSQNQINIVNGVVDNEIHSNINSSSNNSSSSCNQNANIENNVGPLQASFEIHVKRFHRDIVNVFPSLQNYYIGVGTILGKRVWDTNTLDVDLNSYKNYKENFEFQANPVSDSYPTELYKISEGTKILVECFIAYRPDIGYVEGMGNIAVILLLFNNSLYEAFISFANLLHSGYFLDFFLLNRRNVKMRLDFFDSLFREIMPSLAHHFDVLSITSDTYLMSWFTSMFSNCLPIQIIPKVWDSLFLFGEPFAFQVAIAILKYHEHKLVMTSFEGCISILHGVPKTFDLKRFNSALEQFNGLISNKFGHWLTAQKLSKQKADLLEELL
ncbi:Sec7 domain-containing protein [Cryptosporidium serpentis]